MGKPIVIENLGLWAEDYFRMRRVVTRLSKVGYAPHVINGILYCAYLQNTRGYFNSNDFKHPDKKKPIVYITSTPVFEDLRDLELIAQYTYAQYHVSRRGISLLMRVSNMLQGLE